MAKKLTQSLPSLIGDSLPNGYRIAANPTTCTMEVVGPDNQVVMCLDSVNVPGGIENTYAAIDDIRKECFRDKQKREALQGDALRGALRYFMRASMRDKIWRDATEQSVLEQMTNKSAQAQLARVKVGPAYVGPRSIPKRHKTCAGEPDIDKMRPIDYLRERHSMWTRGVGVMR